MLPVVLVGGRHRRARAASAGVWAAVLALALISTAFGYLLYFTLVTRAGATNASLVTLIVPVSAILLGAAVPRRAARVVRGRRHGIDRNRAADDRRPAVAESAVRQPDRIVRLSFLHRPRPRDFRFENKPEGEGGVSDFLNNPVALQQQFPLARNREPA